MISNINIIFLNYHIICSVLYFLCSSIIKILFSVEFQINWLIKLLGTIIGYFFIIIIPEISNKYKYGKKLIKYFIIILFQNILSYIYLNEDIFTLKNFLKIEFYLFFYLLFDKINDNFLDGDNKQLYSDVVRICLTYLIVEKIFGKNFNYEDIINIISIIFSLVIFYKLINNYLIDKFKNKLKKSEMVY
jgi:hypothetical protein